MKYSYGIDISHHQGSVDFAKVKESGVQFVILKVSQDQWKDTNFETYYRDAKNVGLPVGVYIYNKVLNEVSALSEAQFALKCLKGKTLELGVWLDMEDSSMKNLTKNMLSQIVLTEALVIMSEGFNVGIYCNKDWYENVLDTKNELRKFRYWIARYPKSDNGTVRDNLRPNYGCIWQYSSKGKIPGITGNVDLDEMNDGIYFEIPLQEVEESNSEYYPQYKGNSSSLVSALAVLGVDSSYKHRKQIAKANGISLYSGTANQNITMLELLKSGKLLKEV